MFRRTIYTVFTGAIFLYSIASHAGISIHCKSNSSQASVYGSISRDGGEYNLKIKVGGSVQHYQYVCQDPGCKQMIHINNVYLVEALSKKVFTMVLANKAGAFLGRIYAIPSTVSYKAGSNQFTASFKATYYGMDPKTMNNYMKRPIHLMCRLKFEEED